MKPKSFQSTTDSLGYLEKPDSRKEAKPGQACHLTATERGKTDCSKKALSSCSRKPRKWPAPRRGCACQLELGRKAEKKEKLGKSTGGLEKESRFDGQGQACSASLQKSSGSKNRRAAVSLANKLFKASYKASAARFVASEACQEATSASVTL